MGDWKIVVPEATANEALNPAAGTTGSFAAVGGGTMTRSSTYNRYGLYSYRIQTAADDQGGSLTLSALANAIHYVTLQVRGTLPTSWDWSLDNSNYTAPALLETIDGNWSRYGLQFPAVQANGSTTLYIRQSGAGSGDFYVDGVQVEEKEYWTTYCDGDQEGCEWDGAEDASTSSRSASTRAGGRVRDFEDDYGFGVAKHLGTRVAPQSVVMDEYALLPGGELNIIKIHPRLFSLVGSVIGTDLLATLDDLEAILLPDVVPKDENGCQPVRIRYTGGTVQKEVVAHYEGGLEGNLAPENRTHAKVAVRFLAGDPYWYGVGGGGKGGAGQAIALDTNDNAIFDYIARKIVGVWDNLGPPSTAGSVEVYSLTQDDTYIYLGGTFVNWNGNANADRIVRLNKISGAWSALGTGMNFEVRTMVMAPNGDLYAGGNFTMAGGVTVNYVAKWNGSTWSALGTGMNSAVYSLAIAPDGSLYAVGDFTTAGGGAANRIAKWDGATWSALGTGLNNTAYSVVIARDSTLYVAGDFTIAGGNAANRIAKWDGTTWSALGTGFNDVAWILTIASNGTLYAAGNFTTAGGDAANRIAEWNGMTWSALGMGLNGYVRSLVISPGDVLYVGGNFTTAGELDLADRLARWNGSTWYHLDIDLPGIPNIWAMIFDDDDLYIGFDTNGIGYYAGLVTITSTGTVNIHPRIIIERSGGTSARLETVRNETTGKELLFDYKLLDGETLTIDLRPTRQSIVSSMFGPRPDAILANSDLGEFTLRPGDNDITCFISEAGSPTITAWMEWQVAYRGL